jgi:hypothetical protein
VRRIDAEHVLGPVVKKVGMRIWQRLVWFLHYSELEREREREKASQMDYSAIVGHFELVHS